MDTNKTKDDWELKGGILVPKKKDGLVIVRGFKPDPKPEVKKED